MIRSTLKALVVAALAMTLTVVTADNASAAVKRYPDPHDAQWPIDTRQMTVRRAPGSQLIEVFLYSPTYAAEPAFDGLMLTFDSRGGRYADYKLHWDFGGREDRDGWQRFTLYRVRGDRYVRAVFCEGASGKYLREYESFHVWVPRRCLQPNKRIGVRGRTWNWIRYRDTGMPSRGYYDDVPNHGFARG